VQALKRLLQTVIISIVCFIPCVAYSNSVADLQEMEQEIYQFPWKSYQKILAYPKVGALKPDEYLWWLLRKAQSENLLYLYDDFSATVSEAIQRITTTTPKIIQSQLYHFQGMVFGRDGRYKEAVKSFRLAMKIAKEINANKTYLYAKQELAYTQSLTELFEISLIDLQEAFVEAFALNDHFLIAVINETYGAVYGYMGEYEKSISYYEKALATYERLNYPAHMAEAIYGLASTYRYWGKFGLAIAKFELYRQRISYTPNKEISYFGAYGLGMTLAEKGACGEALQVIDEALSLEGIDDYDAELLKQKARCLIQLERIAEASEALEQANDIFEGIPELVGTRWQLEVTKIAGELAFANGELEKAYQHVNDYYDQYIKLVRESASARLVNVKALLELERQEIEEALVSQRSRADDLEHQVEIDKYERQTYLLIFFVTGFFIVVAVVVVQYRNNRTMKQLTITDELSGIYNRRYVFSYLNKMLSEISHDKAQVTVILLDIDNFKRINDHFGHPVGDLVIKTCAEKAQKILRKEDVIGRIGGEEFMCVLPRTNKHKAMVIANRILESIRHHRFVLGDSVNVPVSVSIGVAEFGDDCADGQTLFSHADMALYQAKYLGKDQAVSYPFDD